MAEFDWSVLLNFAVKGASQSAGELERIQKSLDNIPRSAGVSEKAYEQATRSINNATKRVSGGVGELSDSNLPRLRYALYDVATSAGVVGTALTGVGVAAVAAAAQYETAFTAVERTTIGSTYPIEQVRQELLGLARDIPVAFSDITNIASLGAQLGIASEDLETFASTVARFAATTNVSVDSAAQSFGALGELLNVPATEFENLGSAIALVGVNSVATESEILSVATQIGGVAANAGLSEDYVIGLAGALSSLRVPAEQSRGALTKFFQQVNRAAAEGGEPLQNFANIAGFTTEEVQRLLLTEGGMEKYFDAFLKGLSSLDPVSMTQALDTLGLSELRVTNTLTRLAGNLDLVGQTQADAAQGFAEATFLNEAYAVVLDDLNSKFQILVNRVTELAAAAGGTLAPVIVPLIEHLSLLASNLTDFINSDVGQAVAPWVVGLTLVGGALAGLVAVSALTRGSMIALRTALTELIATGKAGAFVQLAAGVLGIGNAAGAATPKVVLLRNALFALARATIIGGVILGITELIFNFSGTMQAVAPVIQWFVSYWLNNFGFLAKGVLSAAQVISTGISSLAAMLASAARGIANFVGSLPGVGAGLSGAFNSAAGALENIGRSTGRAAGLMGRFRDNGVDAANGIIQQNLSKWFDDVSKSADGAGGAAGGAANSFNDMGDSADGAASDLGNLGKGAKGAAREVRTLVDYASDLSGVFDRTFELRFGVGSSRDSIAGMFNTIAQENLDAAKAIADARTQIRDYTLDIQKLNAEISKLRGQRGVQEYFLQVATAYKDEVRAGVIRGEIADINADIAKSEADLQKARDGITDQNKEIAKSQQVANRDLNGNSEAAIKNRETLRNLVSGYQDYIVELAKSGADQATLNRAVDQSEREFIAQATQLGFNRQQLAPYISQMRDLKVAIDNIPRNITVHGNTNPARQALNEFAARYYAEKRGIEGNPIRMGSTFDGGGAARAGRAASLQASLAGFQRQYENALRSGADNVAQRALDNINRISNQLSSGSYASGGYTGAGGKYEPAGVVHKGEYVIPKRDVNQATGLPYADALGRLSRGVPSSNRGYANGGHVAAGNMVVALSPTDRNLLRNAAVKTVSVHANGRQLGLAVVDSFEELRNEGMGI